LEQNQGRHSFSFSYSCSKDAAFEYESEYEHERNGQRWQTDIPMPFVPLPPVLAVPGVPRNRIAAGSGFKRRCST
jgi:hypothetical protein